MSTLRTLRPARRPQSVRLAVQALEARDVPAVFDVTSLGAEVTANGALVRQAGAVPADSGEFGTFLRLRDNGSREEGYNTDARPFQFDQRGDRTVTHSLRLSDIPTVTVNGTVYREFLFHTDEGPRRNNQALSLEELRFFVGATGDLTGYSQRTNRLAGRTAVWDLDGAGNHTVRFNDRLNGTSGKGDAVVLVPDAAFAGAAATDFVYLYSKFGGRNAANGGAEEWGVRPVTPPPAPTWASISGWVYFDANGDGARDANGDAFPFVPEYGVGGVTIHLHGFNTQGDTVDFEITTTDGSFTFTGLQAEGWTYSVTKLNDAEGRWDGLNQAGTAGGVCNESNSDPTLVDNICQIVLEPGEAATNYLFAQLGDGAGPG
jgi:SdrD B-like domain